MKCHNCDEAKRIRYEHVTKIGTFTVTDGSAILDSCAKCGEISLTAAQLAGYEQRAARLILTESKQVGGEVLKFARKSLGLRQKDLAALLRCNEQNLSRLEHVADLDMGLRLAMSELLDIVQKGGMLSVVGASSKHELSIAS